MEPKIRLLLCDDSAVVRRIIRTALRPAKDITVVAEASNGEEAVKLAESAKPDIIVMDVEMPIMDGIDAVRLLRKTGIKTPVIMFSSLTSRGAEATLDAIDAGANDFATKPQNIGHVQNALNHIRDELVPAMRRWAKTTTVKPAQTVQVPKRSSISFAGSIDAIGIGVSTGGPQALSQLFQSLPIDLTVPVFIVQHMPPMFTGFLAERLAKIKGHRVREAVHGEIVSAGDVLIAPGDYHMTVHRSGPTIETKLNQNPQVNSCRPAVDPLFASLADDFGSQSLGVVLTGMGKDGLEGARALKAKGAKVVVQDQQSSVVWGMPGVIYENGLADNVMSVTELANEIAVATSQTLSLTTSKN